MSCSTRARRRGPTNRRYDPTIGRLLGVDPLADMYADQGPANFAGNDPVNQNDPTGAFISDGDPGARGHDRFVYDTGRYGQFSEWDGDGRSLSAKAFETQEIRALLDKLAKILTNSRVATYNNGVVSNWGYGGQNNEAKWTDSYKLNIDVHIGGNIPGYPSSTFFANNSNSSVFFKPEDTDVWGGRQYESHGAYELKAHTATDVPIDGLAAPHMAQAQVLKVVTGTRVNISDGGIDLYINKAKGLIGQPMKGGWKGNTWIHDLNHPPEKVTYWGQDGLRTSESGGPIDTGWNALWHKSFLPRK